MSKYKSHRRLYKIYYGMVDRCCNPNNPCFDHYGGRGITVYLKWIRNKDAFIEWALQNGYSDELTIDRRDNERGYYPENCRWISVKDQANNTSRTLIYEYMGQTKSLREWCEVLSLNYSRTQHRLRSAGWSVEEAFAGRRNVLSKKYLYNGRYINEAERNSILEALRKQIDTACQFHSEISTKSDKIEQLRKEIDSHFEFFHPDRAA